MEESNSVKEARRSESSMMANLLTMRLAMMLHEVPGNGVDLHGKLPGGGDDNCSSAIAWHELSTMQQLQRRNQES